MGDPIDEASEGGRVIYLVDHKRAKRWKSLAADMARIKRDTDKVRRILAELETE